jgi:hypothetical protein
MGILMVFLLSDGMLAQFLFGFLEEVVMGIGYLFYDRIGFPAEVIVYLVSVLHAKAFGFLLGFREDEGYAFIAKVFLEDFNVFRFHVLDCCGHGKSFRV